MLIMGAGGSAKGVSLALARRGASRITIANRSLDRARLLAGLVAEHGPDSKAIPLLDEELAQATAESDLIVNCTHCGDETRSS